MASVVVNQSKEPVEDFKILCANVGSGYYQQQPQPQQQAQQQYQQYHKQLQQALSMSTRATALASMNSNSPIELFEPSPYNIMSDPVIGEQFRKLYEEDEYFQNVHKKCVEWLKKYVLFAIDSESGGGDGDGGDTEQHGNV